MSPSWFHLISLCFRKQSLSGCASVKKENDRLHPNPVTGAPRRLLIGETEDQCAFLKRGSKTISAGSLIPAFTNPARCDCAPRVLPLLSASKHPRFLMIRSVQSNNLIKKEGGLNCHSFRVYHFSFRSVNPFRKDSGTNRVIY